MVDVVDEAKGLALAPNNEFELEVFPKVPSKGSVSPSSSSGIEDTAGKADGNGRALTSGGRILAGLSVRPLPEKLETSSPVPRRDIAHAKNRSRCWGAMEAHIFSSDKSRQPLLMFHVPPVFCPKALLPPVKGFAVAVLPKPVVPVVLEPNAGKGNRISSSSFWRANNSAEC